MCKIKEWYRGKPISLESDPDDLFVIYPSVYYKQPILAKIIKYIGDFWLKHWKWILTTIIAVILGLLAIFVRVG